MDDDIPPVEANEDEGVLDRLRDMPVGTFDPNIIGDAGPLDVPPGSDPPDTGADIDDGPAAPTEGGADIEAAIEGRRAFTQP